MNAFLVGILSSIVGGLILAVFGEMASQEVRDRLDHLPHVILRLAARRLDPAQRGFLYEEVWLPDLAYYLRGDESRPVTRLYHGTRFALGILVSAGQSSRNLDLSATQPDVQVIVDANVVLSGNVWRKSGAAESRDCAEVAITDEEVLLRHSQHPSGPVLTFSIPEWQAFLDGALRGEFDMPS